MRSLEDNDFANLIACACHKQYASLGRSGKPQTKKQWTLLAAVVQSNKGEFY